MSQIEKCQKIKKVSSWKCNRKNSLEWKNVTYKNITNLEKCHQLKNVSEFKLSQVENVTGKMTKNEKMSLIKMSQI